MKKITLLILLFSVFSFGQFFEDGGQQNSHKATNQENQFFNESQGTEPQPDYDVDGPGQPGDVPLDDWAFLLPLAGIAVGAYFIRKKKLQLEVKEEVK